MTKNILPDNSTNHPRHASNDKKQFPSEALTTGKSWITVSKKTHPKFIACLIEFPHVMRCFENIVAHRAPKYGLEKFGKSPESLDLMIEQFFLPILHEEGLIQKEQAITIHDCQYTAPKDRIIVERDALTIQEQAYTVAQVAKNITMDVTEFDTRDTTLTINLSGPAMRQGFQDFMDTVRNSAQKLLTTCEQSTNESTNDCTINIAFLGRMAYATRPSNKKGSI